MKLLQDLVPGCNKVHFDLNRHLSLFMHLHFVALTTIDSHLYHEQAVILPEFPFSKYPNDLLKLLFA
jgi:hypothetical protein